MGAASHWTVFRRIVLPLSKPALATFAIFAFMASWNSFLWPLVVISSQTLMTLPVGLANLHGRYTTAWNLVMAGATISVIPILAVYIAAQKQVILAWPSRGSRAEGWWCPVEEVTSDGFCEGGRHRHE